MAAAKTKTAKATAEPAKKKTTRKKAAAKTTAVTKPLNRRTRKKTPVSTPATDSVPMRRDIELLAYHLWQQRGCPEGSGLEDWAQAEQQLLGSD